MLHSIIPDALAPLMTELSQLAVVLSLPSFVLYLSVYSLLKGRYSLYYTLTPLALVSYWSCIWRFSFQCGPAGSLLNQVVAIASMKTLDLFVQRHNLPVSTRQPPPSTPLLAWQLVTSLRYAAFTPNPIHTHRSSFSQATHVLCHMFIISCLQFLPQTPLVQAVSTLLMITVIWTSMHLLLRPTPHAPPLFGPLYSATSLSTFWTRVWHNGFTSPCRNLASRPTRTLLLSVGFPEAIAHAAGVMAGFGLMAAFHVFALAPLLSSEGTWRIGMFFLLNGVASCAEAVAWGRRESWLKMLAAWSFEITLASWTASACGIPKGLKHIPWNELCLYR